LSDTWQPVEIKLENKDLSNVIGGFAWIGRRCDNDEPITFYLDDIAFDLEPSAEPLPALTRRPFWIYKDDDSTCNHYSPSGWMGDAETPGRISLAQNWPDNPHSSPTAIQVVYSEKVAGWAGVYWLDPDQNWGDHPGGYDLTGADRLTFWARSDPATPNAQVEFVIGGIGYYTPNGDPICSIPNKTYYDSVCPKITQTETLGTTWAQYVIDLTNQVPLPDLSGVMGAFGWVATDEVTFYLDDIAYEFDQ
ncbi:MAG: hypothetical protein PVF45_09370, partial [Anaerolineae bacterium]